MAEQRWSIQDLRRELRRFEAELRAAQLRETSVNTYVGRSEKFLRWLVGEYQPRGPQRLTHRDGSPRLVRRGLPDQRSGA